MITEEKLNSFARDLPIIRPIKEFIHLNLLLPYQHLNFWDALKEAQSKLNAFPFLDLNYYREKIRIGEISKDVIEKKIELISDKKNQTEIKDFIFNKPFSFVHFDQRYGRLHEEWNSVLDVNVIDMADGMLIKWLSMFLDQGIGHWQMPGSNEKPFYQCLKDVLFSSRFLPDPLKREDILMLFPETPLDAIQIHLDYLCPLKEFQDEYCRESFLTVRGWAGLIHTLQNNPDLIPFKRKISLTDFLAVKLILERAFIMSENHFNKRADFSNVKDQMKSPFDDNISFESFRILQESLEVSTYQKYLIQLKNNHHFPTRNSHFQVIFCMDDRECSLRRHLEHLSAEIETFGTAGHFGIEAMYQHPSDPFPKKHCPAPVPPKYFISEDFHNKKTKVKHRGLQFNQIQPSTNLFLDWLFSHINAFTGVVNLMRNLFFPILGESKLSVIESVPDSKLNLLRHSHEDQNTELKMGYSFHEMAEVVYGQLKQIGLVNHFSPLVLVLGHTSTSANNPYFATYGCGACSGRSGGPNSRIFAQMCNNFEVRKILKENFNIHIPDDTFFVSGLHDTCRDAIEIFNHHEMSSENLREYKKLKKYLSVALRKNAEERSQMFKLVSYGKQKSDAHKEVLKRSLSLFETRPEMGHTNVALAIVGKRESSYGLNLNRRSFLQSYDRLLDPDGVILAQTLGAVIPVCSGINLDYFFSRVDNLRFGAGSKLPQNIVGNLGVSHGTESDLLCGLPFQMIDQHTALRLLVIVDQTPEIALKAILGNPLVKQIVFNHWIYYACLDQVSGKFYLFHDGKMNLKEIGSIYE